MKKVGLSFSLLLVVLLGSQSLQADDRRAPLALVYDGAGACDDCAKAAGIVARKAGYRVRYVLPSEILQAPFAEARVWIQPGGNALEMVVALGAPGYEVIRNFVASGGGYMGFCAGAFLADQKVDNANTIDGLGLYPIPSYDYIPNDPAAKILPVTWMGRERHLFFEEGAAFRIDPPRADIIVLAQYMADGAPAVIETRYGKGLVIASGVHPEAPKNWRTGNHIYDPDGVDFDLAVGLLNRFLLP